MNNTKVYNKLPFTYTKNKPISKSTLQNRGFLSLILYICAWFINDPLSFQFGSFTVTPTQIALLFGIAITITRHQEKPSTNYRKISKWILLYFVTVIFSAIHVILTYGNLSLLVLSIGTNVIWFVTVVRELSYGTSPKEWNILRKVLLWGGMITILTGSIELLMGDFLLTSGPAMSRGFIRGVFWVRGLFADKINFSTSITMVILIFLVDVAEKRAFYLKRLFFIGLLGLSFLLLVFSSSWTGLIGAILAVSIVLFTNYKRINYRFLVIILVALLSLLWYYLPTITTSAKLFTSYNVKYIRLITDFESTNFRYLSLIASIKGFQESPLIGVGLGRAGTKIMYLLGLYKPVVPHTAPTNVLLEQGILGFIPFLGFFLTIYIIIFKQWFKIDDRTNSSCPFWVKAWLMGMGIFFIPRLVAYFHYLDVSVYFIWATIVVMSTASNTKEDSSD